MGEHGEQGKHRKKGKHQPDDLKHSTYDSKHSISHQNTLSVNKITQNTLFNGNIWKQYISRQLNQEVHIVWYDMARRLWKIAFPNPHDIIENSKTAAN